MAQCLLSDILNLALKTVLQHLEPQDYANLRQVNRSVCKRTTAYVPYIVLLLFDASSTHQLQQWFQMTQQMQHVTNIHIHVTSAVSADVFDMAMQLLPQRRSKVSELHLLAANALSSSNKDSWSGQWRPQSRSVASVVSLQPLKYLLKDLQELIIKDITIKDLADDLQQLAEAAATAGGWQLQLLKLDAHWGLSGGCLDACAKCCSALLHLAETFPALKHLCLSFPWREFKSVSCIGTASACDCNIKDADWRLSYAKNLKQCQVSAVTLVAAAVNAMAKLKNLERIGLFDIPDTWKPRFEAGQPGGDTLQQLLQQPAVSVAAATAATTAAAAPSLSSGLLPSLSAATAAFATLDDCGCWLLQELPRLKVIYIMVATAKFRMCWRRQQHQQEPQPLSSSSTCHSSAASSSHKVSPTWCSKPCKQVSASEGTSSSSYCLVKSLNLHHPRCSSLAVVDLQYHIYNSTSGLFDLDGHEIDRLQLATLLGALKSLEMLEVDVPFARSGIDTTHVLTVTAAPLHKLKSLILKSPRADQQLLDDLLLPLTAAEGHGSSLETLVVSANLTSTAAATATTAPATDGAVAAVLDQSCNPEQQLAPDAVTACWPHALLQLDGLRELVIHQVVNPPVDLPVDWLPASLEKLECRRVNLISYSAATAAAAVSISTAGSDAGLVACTNACDATHSSSDVHQGPAARCLQLRVLYLADCQLISPSILASDRLQQLTVVNSSWTGGWAAAAAAWPHVSDLAWSEVDATGNSLVKSNYGAVAHSRPDISVSSAEKISITQCYAVPDVLLSFRHLSQLTLHVYDFYPWLSVAFLQPLMQHLQRIKHLDLRCYSSNTRSADCMAMKLWLRQQLPWASVGIVAWYCDAVPLKACNDTLRLLGEGMFGHSMATSC